jgi:hypothetical protein
MKRETYEAQKAFAGEKKPSMLRRCVGITVKSNTHYTPSLLELADTVGSDRPICSSLVTAISTIVFFAL